MTEWRPIDTAPDDGPVLVFQPRHELFEGYWMDEVMAVASRNRFGRWTIEYVSGFEWESELESGRVTHWMPLPSPPQKDC